MLPIRQSFSRPALRSPYAELYRDAAAFIPRERLITDPLRLLTWGTDASFYRLVPAIAVVVESEEEVRQLLHLCARRSTPVTFRAAGTSLSGQAITDSVLVLLGDNWRRSQIGAGAETIALQPGVIGSAANRHLAKFGRKIGPDPASIDAAMIGGIAANNASGMCCGTAQNSYHTLTGMRVILADGTVLDTLDPASRTAFIAARRDLLHSLETLARGVRENQPLAARIRHKYRLKNTTGYSLNALIDFTDPVDILAHLMIGSEGTLGFISEITYRTVPEYADKASALILFDDLETACNAVGGRARRSGRAALGRSQGGAARSHPSPGSARRGAPCRDARLKSRRSSGADPPNPRNAIGASNRRADSLLDRRAGVRAILERAQRHVSRCRRDAQAGHDGDHRGCRVSG
jgi:D-lactate dehydrogenase